MKAKIEVPINCCQRCYFAKNNRCTCKCEGAHHGIGKKIIFEVFKDITERSKILNKSIQTNLEENENE